mmetsp:Transcript_46132/g.86064  ORF Transcript_46132/g.86064 Transcript_46132/m.86064 type:complete len:107 (-) Transcript_46132:1458-1778(-)
MAKEFGSRADMISNKIDEVSRNSIWREHCEKELHMHKLNTNFFIADPKSMPTFPEKPNYVLPTVSSTTCNTRACFVYRLCILMFLCINMSCRSKCNSCHTISHRLF